MSKLVLLLGFIALTFGGFVNGSKNNVGVGIYEIQKGNFSLRVTNYGARITSVVLPDKNGKLTDIVLGYDTAQEYLDHTDHFGAVVGRVAGRIAGAKFTLNGIVYELDANDGNNSIHGGKNGFSQVVWTVTKHEKCNITLTYNSFDGEEGFPGNVSASVTYALIEPYILSVRMEAEALNKPTPINLAQHAFWNLGGHNSSDILSDDLRLFAHHFTPVNEELIPTGEIQPVENTPYDFLTLREIKAQMETLPNGTKGYDTNYVVDGNYGGGVLRPVAVVRSEKSGIKMELWANEPGVQLYTGNSLKNVTGKGGYTTRKRPNSNGKNLLEFNINFRWNANSNGTSNIIHALENYPSEFSNSHGIPTEKIKSYKNSNGNFPLELSNPLELCWNSVEIFQRIIIMLEFLLENSNNFFINWTFRWNLHFFL